jgi:hypothetical protein
MQAKASLPSLENFSRENFPDIENFLFLFPFSFFLFFFSFLPFLSFLSCHFSFFPSLSPRDRVCPPCGLLVVERPVLGRPATSSRDTCRVFFISSSSSSLYHHFPQFKP